MRGVSRRCRSRAQEKALVQMTGHPLEKIKKDMSRAVWKSFLGDAVAALTRRRVDGVEVERAVNLISTQVSRLLPQRPRGRPVRLDRQGPHPAAEGHGRRGARAGRRAELVRVRELYLTLVAARFP